MLSDMTKWWFRSRFMVTAGEKDLSSLPTAATTAWTMSDTVRITKPARGWTLDMAAGQGWYVNVVVVVVVAEQSRGNFVKYSPQARICRTLYFL